jgi:hypothetical protein
LGRASALEVVARRGMDEIASAAIRLDRMAVGGLRETSDHAFATVCAKKWR